jgi:hypothetical protein
LAGDTWPSLSLLRNRVASLTRVTFPSSRRGRVSNEDMLCTGRDVGPRCCSVQRHRGHNHDITGHSFDSDEPLSEGVPPAKVDEGRRNKEGTRVQEVWPQSMRLAWKTVPNGKEGFSTSCRIPPEISKCVGGGVVFKDSTRPYISHIRLERSL